RQRGVRSTMRRMAYFGSGDAPTRENIGMVPRTGGFLDHTIDPEKLPAWITEADIDFYAGEFSRTGFRGGLNWYRNIDHNWELLAPYAGAQVSVPALYVVGDRDLVYKFRGMDQLIPNLKKLVPALRRTLALRRGALSCRRTSAADTLAARPHAAVVPCPVGPAGPAEPAGRGGSVKRSSPTSEDDSQGTWSPAERSSTAWRTRLNTSSTRCPGAC